MLREGGSNEYINPDQVEIMSPLLDQFWNKSVSWTTKAGSTTTLQFIGEFHHRASLSNLRMICALSV